MLYQFTFPEFYEFVFNVLLLVYALRNGKDIAARPARAR